MKIVFGVIIILITMSAVGYLIYQEIYYNRNNANINMVEAVNTSNINSNVIVDEQKLAVEELERSVGKTGLSKLYIVKCSSCHGKDGNGPVGKPIAGKSFENNFSSLMKYKNNEVKNTMMKGLLENTSETELKILAEEISTFR